MNPIAAEETVDKLFSLPPKWRDNFRLPRTPALRCEDDEASVGRPDWPGIRGGAVCELTQVRAIDVLNPNIRVSGRRRGEGHLRSVRRQRRVADRLAGNCSNLPRR